MYIIHTDFASVDIAFALLPALLKRGSEYSKIKYNCNKHLYIYSSIIWILFQIVMQDWSRLT